MKKETIWPAEPVIFANYKQVPLTDARSNLGDLTDLVQTFGKPVMLTKRDRSKAFLAPAHDIWLHELKNTLGLDADFAGLNTHDMIEKLHDVSEEWLKSNRGGDPIHELGKEEENAEPTSA